MRGSHEICQPSPWRGRTRSRDSDGISAHVGRHRTSWAGRCHTQWAVGGGRRRSRDNALSVDAAVEIDRVIAEGRETDQQGVASVRALSEDLVRCATFEGQRYCLLVGWTTRSEPEVVTSFADAAAASARVPAEPTGDLTPNELLAHRAAMTPDARAEDERLELMEAETGVGKVLWLDHQLDGVPLPANFWADHPEIIGMREAAEERVAANST